MPNWIKSIGVGIVSTVAQFHPVVIGLAILMGLDIISGLVRAYKSAEVSSDRSYFGMRKKASVWLLVGVAAVIQHYIVPGQLPINLTVGVAGAFAFTEAISIVENARACGVDIPAVLSDALKNKEEK